MQTQMRESRYLRIFIPEPHWISVSVIAVLAIGYLQRSIARPGHIDRKPEIGCGEIAFYMTAKSCITTRSMVETGA